MSDKVANLFSSQAYAYLAEKWQEHPMPYFLFVLENLNTNFSGW